MKHWPLIIAAVLQGAAAHSAFADDSALRLALKGVDPVSYFTQGHPAMGSSGLNYDFDEARYLFSTPKNRELFAANPDRYVPQFNGLCATGLASGMHTQADPNIWTIIDGKLYVFGSVEARERLKKEPSLLRKSEENFRAMSLKATK